MQIVNLVLEVKKNILPTAEQWAEIVDEAKSFNKESIAIVWGVEDVIERGKQIGKRIGKKVAKKVLDEASRLHDCNYGITWETFDYYIEEFS